MLPGRQTTFQALADGLAVSNRPLIEYLIVHGDVCEDLPSSVRNPIGGSAPPTGPRLGWGRGLGGCNKIEI